MVFTNHTHFPVFRSTLLNLGHPPTLKKRKKIKRKKISSSTCVVNILTGAWSNSQWSSLKENSVLPDHPPEAINCEKIHF